MSNLKEIRQKINKIIDDSEKEILRGIRDEEEALRNCLGDIQEVIDDEEGKILKNIQV